jgi:hypothetical protein
VSRGRSTRRFRVAMMVGAGVLVTGPVAQGQQVPARTDTAAQSFQAARQSEMKAIASTEKQLADLRAGRMQLESRVELVAAKAAEARANELLMSHQTTALRQLDSVLAVSQSALLSQRDRFLALGVMVRERASADLVVVVRVDSSADPLSLEGITLQVDSATAATRRYSPAALDALNAGAVDEVYHSTVLPAMHVVTIAATINGAAQSKAVSVDVPAGAATYVQFAVHNGQLVQSTWTNRSSSP